MELFSLLPNLRNLQKPVMCEGLRRKHLNEVKMLCAVLGLGSVLRAVQQWEVAVVILAVVHIEFFVLTAVQIFGVIVLILYNLRFF